MSRPLKNQIVPVHPRVSQDIEAYRTTSKGERLPCVRVQCPSCDESQPMRLMTVAEIRKAIGAGIAFGTCKKHRAKPFTYMPHAPARPRWEGDN